MDIDVTDYWRLGNRSEIDMKWALTLRAVKASVPDGLSKIETAMVGAAVDYINKNGEVVPLSFDLVMNEKEFKGAAKVEISRFKGLGEMPPAQLKETTMDITKRTLMKVVLPHENDPENLDNVKETADLVEDLMGKKPEARFKFIQENAHFAVELDV